MSLVLAATAFVSGFPESLAAPVCVLLALVAGMDGLAHRGVRRLAGIALSGALLAGSTVLLGLRGDVLAVLALATAAAALVAAAAAFRVRAGLPAARRPERPVLLYNPRSGGGKAGRYALADEARTRGIEPVELTPGTDLGELARQAVDRGADALAMAGGDGSQAVVAAIAAQRSLPFACIPAGTRNHFALDLGVDRDDVVGALDAFVDGRERLVDLAEVNGRVFVNNVSVGVYGDAVQHPEYRDAKLRTLAAVVPDATGPNPTDANLGWTGPDGAHHDGHGTVLVSNNRYLLAKLVDAGTRPRLDEGVLGIVVAELPAKRARPRHWEASSFTLDADGPVSVGIDGEAARLEPPLQFRSLRGVLRVRIAPGHPGASPSAFAPDGITGALRMLWLIVVRGTWSR